MSLILDSALARTQRDHKVRVSHYLWMGNHLHMIFVAQDANQCAKFYMELKKKITESIKALLGLDQLNLWEPNHMVAQILDSDFAIERIAYFYLNPARANLTADIQSYPGLSSWAEFSRQEAATSRKVPYIRYRNLPRVPNLKMTERQDRAFCLRLLSKVRVFHELKLELDAWMDCFDLEQSAAELNSQIMEKVMEGQAKLELQRKLDGKRVIGPGYLKKFGIDLVHLPKKIGRRLFVLASKAELRVAYIRLMNYLDDRCCDLYERACRGESGLRWPPGMFRPPIPALASAVGDWY
jgi:hypothetical protein